MSPPDARRPPHRPGRAAANLTHNGTDRSNWDPEPAHHRRPAGRWDTNLDPGSLLAALDDPPARPSDPDTSWAAGAAKPGRDESRARIRRALKDLHAEHYPAGLTDARAAELLPDIHGPSCVKRRTELVRDGVLVDTGRKERTPRGALAIVWTLAELSEPKS
jgi:hypothetical protein